MPLIRAGDWLVLLIAACVVAILVDRFWLVGGSARSVVVRSGGNVVTELPLTQDTIHRVRGPLGISEVEVRGKRARFASDPSPKQYCVKQGWLARPGEAALCLPNQVSIQIGGAPRYDSLNF